MRCMEFRIDGQIDTAWSEWFEGVIFIDKVRSQTVLTCNISDSSALYGTITKLRDLGLDLVSVNPVEQDGP